MYQVPLSILSGTHKGRKIPTPNTPITQCRPTCHRVKKTVFDVLLHRFFPERIGQELPFFEFHGLDVCAGSGNYGMELLSRGGEHVTFVEQDPILSQWISHTLHLWGWSHRTTLLTKAWPLTSCLLLPQKQYAVIFLDPPYDLWKQTPDPTMDWLAPCWDSLAAGGVLIVESSAGINWSPPPHQMGDFAVKKWPHHCVQFMQKRVSDLGPLTP